MTEEVNKPPIHIATDWNFFLKQTEKKLKISSYFEKENWKINMVYRMRISNVYDPSHFWVVSKENELDAFHKYLFHFYSKYKTHYKVPLTNFKLNMYCVIYTEEAFYRSILVNVPSEIEEESWAFAFLIDFGFMAKVPLDDVYFMTKKMYEIPQFAIRATLSGLGPVGSSTWSADVVSRFNTLVGNKILLCQVVNRNYVAKVLYLKLVEYQLPTKNLESISDILVMERLARKMSIVDVKEMKSEEKKKRAKRSKKVKLPFELPGFSQIEKGGCVDSFAAARYIDQFSSK